MANCLRYTLSKRKPLVLSFFIGALFLAPLTVLYLRLFVFSGGIINQAKWRSESSSGGMTFRELQNNRNDATENATTRHDATENATTRHGFSQHKFKRTSQYCNEKKHVYYIKLHKTGSTTLYNIFLRFGLSRNLSFAIPKEGACFPDESIQVTDIRPHLADKYDMLIHHSTFNPAIKGTIFHKDLITVASLRQPFPLFLSNYYFYRLRDSIPRHIRTNGSAVSQLEQYITFVYNQTLNMPYTAGTFDMNKLSMRLGVPLSRSLNKRYVTDFTQTVLTKEIDFVTIQGYFDESLVLLKRKFCWQTKDILYRGIHVSSRKSTRFQDLSPNVRRQFKELVAADYIIFDTFEKKFLQAIWEEGSDLFDEVRYFKMTIKVVEEFCDRDPDGQDVKVIPRSPWSNQFQVTGTTCQHMHLRSTSGLQEILKRDKTFLT